MLSDRRLESECTVIWEFLEALGDSTMEGEVKEAWERWRKSDMDMQEREMWLDSEEPDMEVEDG